MSECMLLFLFNFALFVHGYEEWRQVNISQGLVRGRMDPESGIYSFFNIPYATAPTGVDKFKAPLPPPVWLSTFDAVDRGIVCPQPFVLMNMQEDCLVANVFVPDTDETNLPVLVSIHGGAYQYGYGNSQRFNELVRMKKLIAVTFNYRLGAHGFLCLGTEGAPGNAGIKDQIALLRWINTNIARFGGNPDDVTLTACSAGSGSIDVLTLSSSAAGLFKKAILESGVSTGVVGVQIDPIENAKKYAKLLNFSDVDNLESLEKFYKSATFQLLTSQNNAITGNENAVVLFGPCVERDIGQERVITDTPMNIIKQGKYVKVPLLYGFANMEGSIRLPFFQTWKNRMNEKFSDFLPVELYFESDDIKEEVARRVKEFYFRNEPVSDETIVSYILYFTDVLFGYPMLRSLTARVESLNDTIYLFEYSFVDEDTASFPSTDVRGAGHCDLIRAVVDQDQINRTKEFIQMQNLMRDNWVNFILTGSPLPHDSVLPPWPPANAQRSPHMSLGPVIELKANILEDRAAFWDDIYEKHYRGPVVATTGGALSHMISNVMLAVAMTFYFADTYL